MYNHTAPILYCESIRYGKITQYIANVIGEAHRQTKQRQRIVRRFLIGTKRPFSAAAAFSAPTVRAPRTQKGSFKLVLRAFFRARKSAGADI